MVPMRRWENAEILRRCAPQNDSLNSVALPLRSSE
jgi:hypothetical protein